MIDLHADRPKTERELRKFGIVMAGAFAVVALILWVKSISYFPLAGAISALFLLLGIGLPMTLRPVEYVWMKIAMLIGAVMTRVILSAVFLLAVTPIGIVMRLVGKDPLRLKHTAKESYWIDADQDGTAARPDKPF